MLQGRRMLNLKEPLLRLSKLYIQSWKILERCLINVSQLDKKYKDLVQNRVL